MIREAINKALESQEMTRNRLCVEADLNRPSLFRFLRGDTTLGLQSVERAFKVLSINVVKDGSFFYYGYDIATAVENRKHQAVAEKRKIRIFF